jgi:Glycine-zipper domain
MNPVERTFKNRRGFKGAQRRHMVLRLAFFAALTAVVLLVTMVPAKGDGLYVYPAKGQSQAQQDRDQSECRSWAMSQTGVDPSRPQTAMPGTTASAPYQPSQRHVVRGAARGAALGAAGGAITGDAGTGAAAGAAMGGLAGGFRRRDERRRQYAQQQATAQASQQSRTTSYYRAMAACLQGRGYTVN